MRYFLVLFWATRKAPLVTDPIISERSAWLLRHLKHQSLSPSDYFIHSIEIIFLVQFLATRVAVVPLAIDPIMSGRLIQSLRHLDHRNPSTISEYKFSAMMVQEFRSTKRRSQSIAGLGDVIGIFDNKSLNKKLQKRSYVTWRYQIFCFIIILEDIIVF